MNLLNISRHPPTNLFVNWLQKSIDFVVNQRSSDLKGDDVGAGVFHDDVLDAAHAQRVAARVTHAVPNHNRGRFYTSSMLII